MPDIMGMIRSLRPEVLSRLLASGPDHELDRNMLDAIDEAAGGPGEGRGYYVVHGSLEPLQHRRYFLRDDVAAALLGPLNGQPGPTGGPKGSTGSRRPSFR